MKQNDSEIYILKKQILFLEYQILRKKMIDNATMSVKIAVVGLLSVFFGYFFDIARPFLEAGLCIEGIALTFMLLAVWKIQKLVEIENKLNDERA